MPTQSRDRVLAKACGAAQRTYAEAAKLVTLTAQLPGEIRRQGNAVIEELDLLRFRLREATLGAVIQPARKPATTKRKTDRRKKGGTRR